MPGSNVYISSGEGLIGSTGSTGGAVSGGASTAIPASAYLGAGLGLLQALNTYQQNSQIANTDSYEDLFTDFGNMDYTGDFNSLIKQRRNSYLSAVPSWKKIRLMNSGAKIGSAFTSAGSGAMAGAGFGPWGIGVGALFGLGASFLGSSRADNKAKQREAELNILRNEALEDNQRNFLAGVKNAEQRNNFLASSNITAFGGPLHTHGADWTNGITIIDSGGSHENNPLGGVPMGIAPDGQPNLVEEGEVIWNDYVFSKRLKVPKAIRNKYKLRGNKPLSFADAALQLNKEIEERPNDPISKRGRDSVLAKLADVQEEKRDKISDKEQQDNMLQGIQPMIAANGGAIHIDKNKRGTFTAAASKHNMGVQEFASKVLANPEDYSPAMRKKANFARNASKWKHAYGGHKFDGLTGLTQQMKNLANLRFAPAIGAGIGALTDTLGVTNRPDYSNADMIMEAARTGVGNMKDVSFTPVGNYLTYKPFDTLFYGNQLASQANATRRAIRNNSGGNRMTAITGLLGADYNAQLQLGNLFRLAGEYNLAQRERVGNFNRTTNEFNSEGFLKAAMANAENSQKKASIRLSAAERAAAIRDAVDSRVGAARSANLTNLFDSLGNIGIDAYNRQDRDMLIRAGVFGTLSQKPQEWSQKRWEDYQKAVSGMGYRNGGILKKRKGITI